MCSISHLQGFGVQFWPQIHVHRVCIFSPEALMLSQGTPVSSVSAKRYIGIQYVSLWGFSITPYNSYNLSNISKVLMFHNIP